MRRKMNKLIPDTNFLIYLSKYKLLDKLLDYQLVLLKPVLEELIAISKGDKEKKADREAAELSLMFLKKEDADMINIKGKADDIIVEYSKENRFSVGTMDKELIKRLKKEKVKIIIIRQKKLVEEI
jgi:rRNA-processing protein FCF1